MQVKILNSEPVLVNFLQKECKNLFETIKIENGKIFNLADHQERVNNSYEHFFNTGCRLNLSKEIKHFPKKGLYRAKLIYNAQGLVKLAYYIYNRKTVKSIMLIEMPEINYRFKFLNREVFENLYKNFNADEFIITKNGFLTDASIANSALFHKTQKEWHTPSKPLLYGTALKRHIKSGRIKPAKIHYKDLKNYSKIAFMNAMVEWQEFDFL